MRLLNGIALSQGIRTALKKEVDMYHQKGNRRPKLVMILMGNDFASGIYVRNKKKACSTVGILSEVITLPMTYPEANLLELIHKLNEDAHTDGILVQLPLPPTITTAKVLDKISPEKDVDGFHPVNMGLLAQGRPHFRACTPYGIMRLLATLPLSLRGMHAVIVGASNIVGKPMMLELLQAECTVTLCHVATRHLARHVVEADLLVSAVGKAGIIQSKWIKSGAIVIDAGINSTETGITGDIPFTTVAKNVYAITPVPGGVGPMTVAMLLENTWTAYQLSMQRKNHYALKGTTA